MDQSSKGGAGLAIVLLALAGLCWSGTHVIGRAMADHVPPFGATFVRWFVPVLILLPFAEPYLRRDWSLIKRHWLILLLLGLPGGPVFSGLQFIGLQYTTATNASLMNSVSPVLIAAMGVLIFRDRISALLALGIATSLAGVVVVVMRGDLAVLLGLSLNKGDLILIANQACWALYSACLRLKPAIHWLSFLFLICLFSAIGVIPFRLWEIQQGHVFHADWLTAGALAYMAIFPGMVAFACYNVGIERIGANRAGAFTHLIPIYSATLAMIFLGEVLQLYHVAGFVLILAGVTLAARR